MDSGQPFTTAFLQHIGNGELKKEEQLIRAECERRGISVILFHAKQMQRRQLPLTKDSFVAGYIDSIYGAMKQLKMRVPAPNDYPKSLAEFMHRRVWLSTLGTVEEAIEVGRYAPVFIKPADRLKSFKGRVFESIDNFRELGGLSRRQDVWCSELVVWQAEFRVYVIGTEILSIDHYAGSRDLALDRAAVERALAQFRASGEAPAAYGIDFGILEGGQTALVEANDGFGLGAYEIDGRLYTDLVMTRWRELLATMPSPPP